MPTRPVRFWRTIAAMPPLLPWLIAALAAYLFGSIQSGLLIGRVVFGIDPRDYGSRRTGATNVLRTMGAKAAVAVVAMDALKAVFGIGVARALLPDEPWAHVLAAFAVAAGHNWPVFAGFRGGKGVIVSATATGMLYWPVLALIVPVGLLVVWTTRYVSLGSMIGAVVTAVAAAVFYQNGSIPLPYLVYYVVGAALVLLTHRENIARLVAGTENRLGQRVHTQTPSAA
jgi:acyl phosphate:glycerol-3-phosphate acyltransferase